ncbi:hypothetical protein HYV71_03120 [Candidatus Uhrbacteria bacterium]|nr:hypothetical protein [Candidatus Uhrbacteria bacterium]
MPKGNESDQGLEFIDAEWPARPPVLKEKEEMQAVAPETFPSEFNTEYEYYPTD